MKFQTLYKIKIHIKDTNANAQNNVVMKKDVLAF
jgi:hypothetical protein